MSLTVLVAAGTGPLSDRSPRGILPGTERLPRSPTNSSSEAANQGWVNANAWLVVTSQPAVGTLRRGPIRTMTSRPQAYIADAGTRPVTVQALPGKAPPVTGRRYSSHRILAWASWAATARLESEPISPPQEPIRLGMSPKPTPLPPRAP